MPEVGVDAALVKLVEDEGAEAGEQRILLQPGGQDPFGRDEQLRVAVNGVEPDLPSDLVAEGPAPAPPRSAGEARAATRRGCSRIPARQPPTPAEPSSSCPPRARQ